MYFTPDTRPSPLAPKPTPARQQQPKKPIPAKRNYGLDDVLRDEASDVKLFGVSPLRRNKLDFPPCIGSGKTPGGIVGQGPVSPIFIDDYSSFALGVKINVVNLMVESLRLGDLFNPGIMRSSFIKLFTNHIYQNKIFGTVNTTVYFNYTIEETEKKRCGIVCVSSDKIRTARKSPDQKMFIMRPTASPPKPPAGLDSNSACILPPTQKCTDLAAQKYLEGFFSIIMDGPLLINAREISDKSDVVLTNFSIFGTSTRFSTPDNY